MRRALLAIALLSLSACARNAILEITIELPEAITLGETELRMLSGDAADFESPRWADAQVARLGTEPSMRVDVVAEGEAIEAPLAIRLRLCEDDRCPATAPEVRVGIERAFYAGAHTWIAIEVPLAPVPGEPPIFVGRCDVGGCLEGETRSFCRLEPPMRHYCE
jgi:hypothetical protein